jgi:hypothetical protein
VEAAQMRLDGEKTAGIGIGLLGLAGVGIPMVAPQHPEIGWAFIGAAGLGAIGLIAHHCYYFWQNRTKAGEVRKMAALVGMVVCGIGFLASTGMFFWNVGPGISQEGSISTSKEGAARMILLRNYPDSVDRQGLRAALRKLYVILSEGFIPSQAAIHAAIDDAFDRSGGVFLPAEIKRLQALQDGIADARKTIIDGFVNGNLYSDEVWDILGNGDPINADIVALGNYITALKAKPTKEQMALIAPVRDVAKDANFKAGTWADACIKATRRKLDAVD